MAGPYDPDITGTPCSWLKSQQGQACTSATAAGRGWGGRDADEIGVFPDFRFGMVQPEPYLPFSGRAISTSAFAFIFPSLGFTAFHFYLKIPFFL